MTNESFCQNQKTGFFAYAIVNLLEWLVRREAIWYMLPCHYGRLSSVVLEAIYSNIVVVVVVVFTMVLERTLDTLTHDSPSKFVILVVFVVLFSDP